MPTQVPVFLFGTPLGFLHRHAFTEFYSSPALVERTRNKAVINEICRTSYDIAMCYLTLGEDDKAWALALNGAFVGDDLYRTFEYVYGSMSTKSSEVLFEWLSSMEIVCASSLKSVSDHVGEVDKKSSPKSDGKEIQLILVDDTNTEEPHILNIGLSTTLKTLFNDYADKQGVSLRSLRFSKNGKTLFLSNIGNKTPDELHMEDQDVITVCNTNNNVSGGSGSSNPTKKHELTPKQPKKYHNPTKKTQGKREKTRNKEAHVILSPEVYKARHSQLLSKLHEEADNELKKIRMRLNYLDLERQPPKKKRKNKRKKSKGNVERQIIVSNSGVGGKAGQSCFMVQVGEIQNLYKTTKMSKRSSSCNASILDLHGCTKDEALAKLDESLVIWVDAAMRGSYPFVMPVKIICGCGGQVLSETVEQWIRAHDQVANSPKGSF